MPTTASPPTTAVAGGSLCTSGQLSVTTGSSQGAAGTEILPLVFTNTSSEMCTLQGYPGVSAVIANGVQLGQPATRGTNTSTPVVALEPGQTTGTDRDWSPELWAPDFELCTPTPEDASLTSLWFGRCFKIVVELVNLWM